MVLVALWSAIPTVFGPYYTNLFVTFAIFAVFSVSLNLLLGYTGLFSFGHAMFFGAGGYGTALALKHIFRDAAVAGRWPGGAGGGRSRADPLSDRGQDQRNGLRDAAPRLRPGHVRAGAQS